MGNARRTAASWARNHGAWEMLSSIMLADESYQLPREYHDYLIAKKEANMTTTEAAAALKVNRQRVRALIASGRLAASKKGRDWWITLSAVEACRATLDANAKYKRKS